MSPSPRRPLLLRALLLLTLALLAATPTLAGQAAQAAQAVPARTGTASAPAGPSSAAGSAATSGAPSPRKAAKPRLFLKLSHARVAAGERVRAKVALGAARTRPGTARAVRGAGKIKVVVQGGTQPRHVRGALRHGKAVLRLPVLPQGAYRVRATLVGNDRVGKVRSAVRTLRVQAGGGQDVGTPTGFPNASNTGVKPGTALTAYTGPSTISKAGTVIEGKTLGCIEVTAPGVVIRNSTISCKGSPVLNSDGEYSGTPLLLEDVEIDCQDGPGTAVGEALYTVRRADIHGCENGFDMNQSITVEDSYIHDLYEGGGSHTDGIQLASGHWNGSGYSPGALNITIRHNTIYGVGASGALGTSAIISNPSGDKNVLIEGNLLAGGAYTLYCDYEGTASNYRVVANHFSRQFSAKVGAYGPSDGCSDETLSGNVYHDTGAPIRLP